MEQVSVFDPTKANALVIVRNGLFNPSFTMTDGVNIYGRLSYLRVWRRRGNVEMAHQNWTIEPQKLFSRETIAKSQSMAQTITITKTDLWRGNNIVEFSNGQRFEFKRDSIFSRKQLCYNEQHVNILTIESKPFSYKQPFKIICEPNTSKNNINFVLIAFIGVHLILLRKAHAAAAH
jgi:hypothetical protein